VLTPQVTDESSSTPQKPLFSHSRPKTPRSTNLIVKLLSFRDFVLVPPLNTLVWYFLCRPIASAELVQEMGTLSVTRAGVREGSATAKAVLVVQEFDETRFMLTVLVRKKRASYGGSDKR
jgi:hypothetical protein